MQQWLGKFKSDHGTRKKSEPSRAELMCYRPTKLEPSRASVYQTKFPVGRPSFQQKEGRPTMIPEPRRPDNREQDARPQFLYVNKKMKGSGPKSIYLGSK